MIKNRYYIFVWLLLFFFKKKHNFDFFEMSVESEIKNDVLEESITLTSTTTTTSTTTINSVATKLTDDEIQENSLEKVEQNTAAVIEKDEADEADEILSISSVSSDREEENVAKPIEMDAKEKASSLKSSSSSAASSQSSSSSSSSASSSDDEEDDEESLNDKIDFDDDG